jgi:ribosomal protein S8
MGRKRNRRAEKVKHGYSEKKRSVCVERHSDGLEKVVDRRVVRGYRKGWTVADNGEDMEVLLAYTSKGGPVRQERRVIERPFSVSHTARWARTGGQGSYRRQTTEGRRTIDEARKQELGGLRRLYVS